MMGGFLAEAGSVLHKGILFAVAGKCTGEGIPSFVRRKIAMTMRNVCLKADFEDKRAPFGGLVTGDHGLVVDKFREIPTPCYVLDEAQLRRNGEILKGVQERTGCRILLAQKAFSNYDTYPMLADYLAGTEASGLFEAKLGARKMPGKEVHVFCGAYREKDMEELLCVADHIVFNSPRQLEKFGPMAKAAGKSLGLRVNPERSTQDGHEIYDPCAPGGRLGTTRAQWDACMNEDLIGLLDGLHFHTLCEQNSDDLEVTLEAVEEKFGEFLPRMKWLNFGGGHHITRPDYDIPLLEKCILHMKEKYDMQIYLEPGEAVALNAGYLLTEVLDVRRNGEVNLAILDVSAACHMPDVLEMPYLPPLMGALHGDELEEVLGKKEPDEANAEKSGTEAEMVGLDAEMSGTEAEKSETDAEMSSPDGGEAGTCDATEKPVVYRLGGPTCLAGDVTGDYGFKGELQEGDVLIFGDMAIYTTCKNNTFNGMPLPDIWLWKEDGSVEQLTQFGYEDFEMRLGRR